MTQLLPAIFSSAMLLTSLVAAAEGPSIQQGGRSVTFSDAMPRDATGYDSPWHYAHAIRAGDFVYLSGMIIAAAPDDELPIGRARFAEATARVFARLQAALETAGASFEQVVKINTYHVLDGRNTALTIDEQALVVAEARASYAGEPHAA